MWRQQQISKQMHFLKMALRMYITVVLSSAVNGLEIEQQFNE